MRHYEISYSLSGRATDRIYWADREGSNAGARQTALHLLDELRTDHPRAAVFMDGTRVRGGAST